LEAGFLEHINKTTLSTLIKSKKTYRIINNLVDHYNNVNQSYSTKLLIKEGIKSNLTIPIYFNERVYGFLFLSSFKKNTFNEHHALFARNVINIVKHNIYNHFISQEIISSTANGFIKLLEGKDNETGNHIVRVSHYCRIISRKLEKIDRTFTPKYTREIFLFSPLHDIGKVGIPDSVLLKPGRLDIEEFKIMKQHVNIGEKIINDMNKSIRSITELNILKIAKDIISSHHEKWDGSGYPRGLKGDQIPIAGRIVALADVFDALCSKRPYKEPFTFDEALDMVTKASGSHFDPRLVDIFHSSIPEIKEVFDTYKDELKNSSD